MTEQEQSSTPEVQPQFFSQATYVEQSNGVKTNKLSLQVRPLINSILQGIAQVIQNFFYQTTITEKVVILCSILVIVFSFTKWGLLGKEVITGINHATFLIGWLLIASALCTLSTMIWYLSGKPLPKIFPSLAAIEMFMGIEIIQLGILGYTIILSYGKTLSFDMETPTFSPLYIVLFGTLIFAAGLFEERNSHKRSAKSIKLPQDMYARPEDDKEELERILKSE